MALTRIKEKFQITLPLEPRNTVHFSIGDLVDVTAEGDELRVRAKHVVDRKIIRGMADIAAGRVSEAFDNIDDLMRSLEDDISAQRRKQK